MPANPQNLPKVLSISVPLRFDNAKSDLSGQTSQKLSSITVSAGLATGSAFAD